MTNWNFKETIYEITSKEKELLGKKWRHVKKKEENFEFKINLPGKILIPI